MYHLSADYATNERLVEKNQERETLIEAGFSQNNYTDERIEEMVQQLTTEDDVDRRIIEEFKESDEILR